jgi:hypothetical protein
MRKRIPLKLHIEELVLHGFPNLSPLDGQRIRDAVQFQLTGLLSQNKNLASFTRDSNIPHLDGGVFESAPGAGTGIMGTRIAQNVYSSLAGSMSNKGDNKK